MNKLFNAICEGLKTQGYKEQGGRTIYKVFDKDKEGIKICFQAGNRYNIIVRYYYKDEE